MLLIVPVGPCNILLGLPTLRLLLLLLLLWWGWRRGREAAVVV
jgi:hypothetical protein